MKHATDKANITQIYLRKSLSKISQPAKKDRNDKRKNQSTKNPSKKKHINIYTEQTLKYTAHIDRR